MPGINLQLEPAVLRPLIREIVSEVIASLEGSKAELGGCTNWPTTRPRPPACLACGSTSFEMPGSPGKSAARRSPVAVFGTPVAICWSIWPETVGKLNSTTARGRIISWTVSPPKTTRTKEKQ